MRCFYPYFKHPSWKWEENGMKISEKKNPPYLGKIMSTVTCAIRIFAIGNLDNLNSDYTFLGGDSTITYYENVLLRYYAARYHCNAANVLSNKSIIACWLVPRLLQLQYNRTYQYSTTLVPYYWLLVKQICCLSILSSHPSQCIIKQTVW